MYKAIRTAKDISTAQNQFLRSIRKALPQKLHAIPVGYRGGHTNVKEMYSNGLIWYAYQRLQDAPIPRYWNAFGSGQPSLRKPNTITVETNVGLRGLPGQLGALFARDDSTANIVLLHRGRIGGGGQGVGQEAFLRWYKGTRVTYVDSDDLEDTTTALFVSDLNSNRFAHNVSNFVEAVRRFKAHIFQGNLDQLSDRALDEKAGNSPRRPPTSTSVSVVYVRNRHVAELVKRRAQGKCELCKRPAPFTDCHGKPYLESHHINWLANGGSDTIGNTVALCPNCHRKMHILQDEKDVDILTRRALHPRRRS